MHYPELISHKDVGGTLKRIFDAAKRDGMSPPDWMRRSLRRALAASERASAKKQVEQQ
ncbi:hypothetical protein [Candidatus Poriferisodalis sp.]|uniref:hypothetical protein n=1 Tax=Candidatus Poriferisodalis sp. TaxID=3101277 RepID=UPI003B022EBA